MDRVRWRWLQGNVVMSSAVSASGPALVTSGLSCQDSIGVRTQARAQAGVTKVSSSHQDQYSPCWPSADTSITTSKLSNAF